MTKKSIVKRGVVSVIAVIALMTIFSAQASDAHAASCWYEYQWVCDGWGHCMWQYVWVCM